MPKSDQSGGYTGKGVRMDCEDLLRIDSATYERIVSRIRSTAATHSGASKRRSERLEFLLPTSIIVVFHYELPAQRKAYQVRPIDLSEVGLGFLHGKFVHNGTPVLALIKNLDGQYEQISGRTTHAHLVEARVHVIGMEFDQMVDPMFIISPTDLRTSKNRAAALEQDWTDLVKLPAREVDRILEQTKARDSASLQTIQRSESRLDYREGAMLVILNPQEPDKRALFRVAPTNLSTCGVGFLHGAFVYPGTRCDVMLTNLNGQPELIRGVVARCELAKGRVHTVGVRFDEPIETAHYIAGTESDAAA